VDCKRIIEAALFAADRPLSIRDMETLLVEQGAETATILAALAEIASDYEQRPIELKQVASGYRFQVREELSPWIARLFQERPAKYSKAVLEILAIIAYRQPVTRGDIEAIRGVSVSSLIIRGLIEREWIEIVGHREVPGRPALYGTTQRFLDYFNLQALSDLPALTEVAELDAGHASTRTTGSPELALTDPATARNA
jgi:segregation and condensation protein B